MHDRVEMLLCDQHGCDQEYTGPASRIRARARNAGWQAREVSDLRISEDGPDLTHTDRCPDHHVPVLTREEVLAEAGGPGGVQPWQL